ncbi:MAG: TetR/AcrR family transcriptional regulator [Candidatus Nanopelagicales bacterium]|nr:TetR/AcrR family transcriptional regulator [Candidatus Nanopelagicales bacterium]
MSRVRMTAQQRREQLLSVGKTLFASRGYEAVTVEEIAAAAEVSKPVVYEHFGGKEGLYAVIVDREMQTLVKKITESFTGDNPRLLLEQAGMALFDHPYPPAALPV